jgi:NAD(P)H-hydrate epimerase
MERSGRERIRGDIGELLPPRPPDMDKTGRGRLLVAGGSKNYPGAAVLASLGALRSGCGIVSLLSLPEVCQACASRLPEAVQLPVPLGEWLPAALENPASALVVGPGLGRSEEAIAFVAAVWEKWNKPLLADADALYALAVLEKSGARLPGRCDAVLTPHEGEAARLLSAASGEVRRDRSGAAEALAKRWGCVLLKGSGTLVAEAGVVDVSAANASAANAEGDTVRLDEGGPELSVPGSGDVLSGCIGTFLAQKSSPFKAACLGGTLHGMAGRLLREKKGVDGILASEIADAIPYVIRSLRDPIAD